MAGTRATDLQSGEIRSFLRKYGLLQLPLSLRRSEYVRFLFLPHKLLTLLAY